MRKSFYFQMLLGIIFTFSFPVSLSAQNLTLVRQDEKVSLRTAITRDTDATETETPWFLAIAKDEIIEIQIPADQELVSDKTNVVAVFNKKFLVGTGKRGDANITLKISATNAAVSINLGNGYAVEDKIPVRIISSTDRKIEALPILKTYKDVKDTYGKRIAKNYIVVKVLVNNANVSKQYLVQNVSIAFDPNQCQEMKFNYEDFDEPTCEQAYEKYFKFPTTIMPTDNETMLGVANTERYRSKRFMLFQGMKFFADIGGGLTGFNLLGEAGITGFNFLGGTLFNALDAALPKLADQKKQNLENAIPKENVIVKGNGSEEVNIFIPADRVFNSATWETYKKTVGKMSEEETNFKRYVMLFLVAKSNGILIDENSKQVESKTGGGAKRFD